MSLKIRDAVSGDGPDILALEAVAFSAPWDRTILDSQMPDERHVLLTAEEDGRFAGYVGMLHVLDEGYISNVAVRPEHRGRGIAKALVAELLARGRALGLSFVTLEVRVSNAPAIAVYAALGFREVGRRPGYYSRPTEDAILMTRFFEEGEP